MTARCSSSGSSPGSRPGSPRASLLAALVGSLGVMLGLALGLTGCFGDSGTLSVTVVTAPASTLMDSVVRVRLTLSEPRTVAEAVRKDGRFSLSLEASVDGDSAVVTVEGFDDLDRLVAYGSSPPFAAGPLDAGIVVYVASPLSFDASPVHLAVGRFELGAAPLAYGAVIVGGRDNANAPRAEVEIYNAYDHSLVRGLDLPQPRAGVAVAAGLDGRAFFVGGRSADDNAQAGGWAFDTTVAPAGAYTDLLTTAPPRADQRLVPISSALYLLTGAPAQLDPINLLVSPIAQAPPALPSQTATVVVESSRGTEIIAIGTGGSAGAVVRYRGGVFDQLTSPSALRINHAVVSTADGQIAVIAGDLADELTADVVKIDPIAGTSVVTPDVLETPRRRAAVARAGAFIVVAGGIAGDGTILGDAELLDSTTLAHVATIPLLAPRAAAEAIALPNDQVLLIGGLDGRGRPTDVLELFTPEPR